MDRGRGAKGSKQGPVEDTAAFGGIAERFRRAGDHVRAVALCREGLAKFPEHLSARVTLGWALIDQGKFSDAQVELEQVLKRAPDNLAAIRGLAELHDRAENAVELPLDGPGPWPPDPEAIAAAEALAALSAEEKETAPAPAAPVPEPVAAEPPAAVPVAAVPVAAAPVAAAPVAAAPVAAAPVEVARAEEPAAPAQVAHDTSPIHVSEPSSSAPAPVIEHLSQMNAAGQSSAPVAGVEMQSFADLLASPSEAISATPAPPVPHTTIKFKDEPAPAPRKTKEEELDEEALLRALDEAEGVAERLTAPSRSARKPPAPARASEPAKPPAPVIMPALKPARSEPPPVGVAEPEPAQMVVEPAAAATLAVVHETAMPAPKVAETAPTPAADAPAAEIRARREEAVAPEPIVDLPSPVIEVAPEAVNTAELPAAGPSKKQKATILRLERMLTRIETRRVEVASQYHRAS